MLTRASRAGTTAAATASIATAPTSWLAGSGNATGADTLNADPPPRRPRPRDTAPALSQTTGRKTTNVTADLTAILDEIDRQLLEVRAAADGLATKAGLLIAAAGVAAAVLAPAIHPGDNGLLLDLTVLALAASLLAGVTAVMPWLQLGPRAAWLIDALVTPTQRTTDLLNDSKAVILVANHVRLRTMRRAFTLQAFATAMAAALALSYAAGK
jgi:hypothetical protein